MSATKQFTYSDVSEHTAKTDLFLVVHDKVYDCSSFVDEHPGGEEVMLDVGGQDATEAFEDVGHSDEARELLEGLLVGTLKRQAGDPAPKTSSQGNPASAYANNSSSGGGLGPGVYAIILIGGALAYFAYTNLQNQGKA